MKAVNFLLLTLLLGSVSQAAKVVDINALGSYQSGILTQTEQPAKPLAVERGWPLSAEAASALRSASVGQTVSVSGFPWMPGHLEASGLPKTASSQLVLRRYDVFAPDARIRSVTRSGEVMIARPNLLAFAAVPSGVGLLLDPVTGDVSGLYNHDGVSLEIKGNLETGLDLRKTQIDARTDESIHHCSTEMANQPGDLFTMMDEALSSHHVPVARGTDPSFETRIAVDTDNEWMAGKGDNVTTATNYITSLFVNMNVFYERDLDIRLLIGDVFLRIDPPADPFPTEPNIVQYLTDFGEFWRVNQGAIDRDFALLLSGQSIGSNSFSGIAWINQYCQNGFLQNMGTQTVGSYSINRIGTNFSAAGVAEFVGHEIGHNMGSPHTHCYNPPVDVCFNGESDFGCYGGAVSCPAGGSGTIMSYCHFGPPNGANCGNNNDEFHPTVINLLNNRIVANSPVCIAPFAGDVIIFEDGFED